MALADRGNRGNTTVFGNQGGSDLSSLFYSNPRIPSGFNGNPALALDYILAALYPNFKGVVANPGALPVSPAPNDYYLVTDDGDGKSAGYVWTVFNGVGTWVKRYDLDWSFEQILAETVNVTSFLYTVRTGRTDLDSVGSPITGTFAGQRLYGGTETNQNLTFTATAFDTTGFVQTSSPFRPTADNTLDLGTSPLSFRSLYYKGSLIHPDLSISGNTITSGLGEITLSSTNLRTTGFVRANSIEGGATSGQRVVLTDNTITAQSGTLNLSATSFVSTTTALNFSNVGPHTLGQFTLGASGSFTNSTGTINLGSNNLVVGGTLTLTGLLSVGNLQVDDININGNVIQTTTASTNLVLNATGTVNVTPAMNLASALTVSANATVTGSLTAASLLISGSTIQPVPANTSLNLFSTGTGTVNVNSNFLPTADDSSNVGSSSLRFQNLFLSGQISNGTNNITLATLMSLRDITAGVSTGFSLFWDGTKFVASAPDTEITHSTISGLTTGDAGHTQFVMLSGRAGGQNIRGGTANSENLTLESTSAATKGFVLTSDTFAPVTDATFSGGWLGTDLGSPSRNFRDLYTKGELRGARFQNFTTATLPANSGQNIGRAVWDTTVSRLKVDDGTQWVIVGSGEKFVSDTVWSGSELTKDITVSSTITDARNAIWQIVDNANNFERIYCSIQAISASVVRVSVNVALPAGSYRLIGLN